MTIIRCLVCNRKMPTLKYLTNHYLKSHSKLRIVKLLLKYAILHYGSYPLILKKPNKKDQKSKFCDDTKTMYMNGNLRIVYGPKQIMIEDGADNMEVLFDGVTSVSKDKMLSSFISDETKPIEAELSKMSGYCTNSPSASSESSSTSLMEIKKKIRRKKISKRKGYYRINITKLKNEKSLNEGDGQFYICHCRENNNNVSKFLKEGDMRILASDTESCSDTGKHCFMPIIDSKIFCDKCGSGYKTKSELTNHLKVHETFCSLCSQSFSNELMYKKHMRLHIFKLYLCHVCKAEFPLKELLCNHFERHMENKILENVLDMEDDYGITRYSHRNKLNYNDSISSIICYLKDGHNYGYSYMKIVCDICGLEILVCDYERHLQNAHYMFGNI